MSRLDQKIFDQLLKSLNWELKDAIITLLLTAAIFLGFLSHFKANPEAVFSTNFGLSKLSFTLATLLIVFISQENIDIRIKNQIAETVKAFIFAGIGFLVFAVGYSVLNFNQKIFFTLNIDIIPNLIVSTYFLPSIYLAFGITGLIKIANSLGSIGYHLDN